MSSVGQVVGGVVGAVVGFFTPLGPVYGAQIGMMIGGLVDPPKGPDGPRLEDLTVQTATYGAFISRNYGTIAQSGNVFWLKGDKLTEKKAKQSSGKGGPESTVYNYSATFAVGLCKGPIDAVSRIWIGPDLLYDARSTDLDTIVASSESSKFFTLYTGTDTQNPDPLIQADRGIASTPAYRGLAYIVFDNLPLEKYGNSLMQAQVKVEIVKNGSSSHGEQIKDTTELYLSSARWADERFVAVSYSDKSCTSFDGSTWVSGTLPLSAQWQKPAYGEHGWMAVNNTSQGAVSVDGIQWKVIVTPDTGFSAVGANGGYFLALSPFGRIHRSQDNGATWALVYTAAVGGWARMTQVGSTFLAASNLGACAVSLDDGATWTPGTLPAGVYSGLEWNGSVFVLTQDFGQCRYSTDGLSWTTGGLANTQGGLASVGGVFYVGGRTTSSSILQSIDNGITWTIAVGTLAYAWNYSLSGESGVLLGLNYTAPKAGFYPRYETSAGEALSTIVQSECLVSNLLSAGDIDVTELTDEVRGYRVTSKGPIRNSLDPLRAAWPFDVVQRGYKIKFKKRGSASVITIPASDLDARESGQAPGVQITDSREMDLMMPRMLSVKYLDVTREYDINEQSESRINTDAVNLTTVDMPIVLVAEEGKRKAAMLLYLAWLERYDVAFVLPPTYQHLEPADVINIAAEHASYNLRLTSVGYLPDGRLECKAKYDSASVYTQVSVAGEGQSTGAGLALSGPSAYELLDIPLLRDDDNTAGFPLAMCGYLTGWPGGILYRSDDAGQTWADLIGVVSPGAVIGYATTSLTAHGGTAFDKSSTLAARLYSGTPSSVTEAQVFAGQNWFAYGVDGRWEIIAAQNCVLQGDGSYLLSGFMRGQKGTEWATGMHASNDRLVLLDAAKLDFISVNASTIGASRGYRAITGGKGIDSDATRTFAYTGVNLECLSPVHLTGNRHPSTSDWALTWVRRGRLDMWRDYVDLPLGEASESYEVDVFSSGTYATLKRTITSSTQSAAYTSAQQVTDFGSNQTTLYLKIYQLSATVGRGYPRTIAITR